MKEIKSTKQENKPYEEYAVLYKGCVIGFESAAARDKFLENKRKEGKTAKIAG